MRSKIIEPIIIACELALLCLLLVLAMAVLGVAGEPQLRFEPAPKKQSIAPAPPAADKKSGTNGGAGRDASKPSNSTGLDHSVDANKMVEKPVPVPPPQFQPPMDGRSKGSQTGSGLSGSAKTTQGSPAKAKLDPVHKVRIRFYTAKHGCAPCKNFLEWRKLNGGSLGCPLEHLQFENMDKAGEAFPEGIPRFELTKADGSVEVRTGWSEKPNHDPGVLCPGCLRNWIQQAKGLPNLEFDFPAADQRVAAAGVVGASSARAVVQQAIEMIKTRIGVGVPFGLVWDRNGKQQLPLLRNQDFSLEAVLGTSGEFTVSAKGAKNLPVEEFWLRYKDVGDKYLLTFGTEVKKPSRKATAASAQTVGAIDPASLSMLFSLGNALWSVFHPQADITLGGRVSITCMLTGDTLGIDFKDCPLLHFHMMADFLFGVRRAELAADKCRVIFLPKNFWAKWTPFLPEERTILIN